MELCSDPLSSQPFSPAKGQLRGAILNWCFYGFWVLLSHSCRGFKVSVLPQAVNVLCCPGTMGLLTPVESFLSPRGWLGWSFSGFPVFALRILRMLQARGVGCHKDQCPDNEPLLSVAHRNTSSHNDSHCFHDGKYFICQRLLACKFPLSERSRTFLVNLIMVNYLSSAAHCGCWTAALFYLRYSCSSRMAAWKFNSLKSAVFNSFSLVGLSTKMVTGRKLNVWELL